MKHTVTHRYFHYPPGMLMLHFNDSAPIGDLLNRAGETLWVESKKFFPDTGRKMKLLGLLSDFTPDKFAECVESILDVIAGDRLYRDYTRYGQGNVFHFEKPEDSFRSMLNREKIYWGENPLGERPEPSYGVIWDSEGDLDLWRWERAQESVIYPNRTLVFINTKNYEKRNRHKARSF